MSTRRTRWALLLALVGLVTAGLMAQPFTREAYRDAYRVWREAEPDLERAAVATGDPLEERAQRAAAEAAKFGAARSAFLRQLAEDQKQNSLPLQDATPLTVADVAPARNLQSLVSTETATVQKTIATFVDDKDRGIQKLRQALEKEQSALAALDDAIAQRENAQEKLARAADAIEPARVKALSEYQSMTGALTESAEMVDKETAAWITYYPALAENARGVRTAAVPSPATSSVAPVSAEPRTPIVTVTPLPLTRYTGEWVYPTVNGRFHGSEPDTVALEIHEENGRATGTFFARFKVPRGSNLDPVVRFEFGGEFAATRDQKFSILSGGGAKGTIELIPGNAFNLLEINFQMDPVRGKITSDDLLLVKK